jgi:CheY-like chemotaxis protein/predicted regulator of Ras-like GTPase activity (Roadblock/LC7/MglB family)
LTFWAKIGTISSSSIGSIGLRVCKRGEGELTVAQQRILVVDSSEAFATMLQEGLESTGQYHVIVVSSGTEALDVLVKNQIDLAIIDMGLKDMDGLTLVQSMRQSKADLRIVLIPLFGQELGDETLAQEVQGILPKPFFIGDLPRVIQEALKRPFGEGPEAAASTPVQAPEKPRSKPSSPSRAAFSGAFTSQDVGGVLEELFQEIRAEAVLFIRGAELIAHAGNITRQRGEELAVLAEASLNAAHKIAVFLEETDDRFEQCTFEGDEYSVYSMNVTPDTILSVALSAKTPVGIVRYNLRQAAKRLADVWHG